MVSDIEYLKSNGDVEGLLALLQDNRDNSEKGWMARLDAAEALAQLGDRRGLEYLQRMAESPKKDIREIALEILDGLKDYQPEPVPPEPVAQPKVPAQPGSESLFFTINARYPYAVAWAAFVALIILVAILLNSFASVLLALIQTWLPARISTLLLYLLLLYFGFLVFRFVIKIFVLPYETRS